MQEIASRRMEGLRFAPVFNYLYKDGARMVTVGGMVVSHEELAVVRRVTDAYKEFYTADQPCRIAAPPLTPKEKATLDTLLPRSLYINEKKLGFALEKDQIEQYRKFYRQYPVFWKLSRVPQRRERYLNAREPASESWRPELAIRCSRSSGSCATWWDETETSPENPVSEQPRAR